MARLPSDSSQPILASDDVPVGGIGYVVPVGGLEMTGVRLEFGSLLLQALNNIRPQTNTYKKRFLTQRRNGAAENEELVLCVSVAPLRRCVKKLFLALILTFSFSLTLRHGLTGHTIL